MGDVIVGIHQPNFFPWFGYFLKIARSNKFVFLDDVQISNTSSYVNRTSININGQAKWLTAPIRRTQKEQTIYKHFIFFIVKDILERNRCINTIDAYSMHSTLWCARGT